MLVALVQPIDALNGQALCMILITHIFFMKLRLSNTRIIVESRFRATILQFRTRSAANSWRCKQIYIYIYDFRRKYRKGIMYG